MTENLCAFSKYFHSNFELILVLYAEHGRTDSVFLVPMHGGIWTLCIDLSESEMRQLGPYGFPNAVKCISYLAQSTDINTSEEYSQHGSYQTIRRPSMSKPSLAKPSQTKTEHFHNFYDQ